MWNKYSSICVDCDALIEITTLTDLKYTWSQCPCGSNNVARVSEQEVTQLTPLHLDFVIPLPYN